MVVAFAGRSAELLTLHDAWRSVNDRRPRVVGVTGSPGIGKTVLIQQFLREAQPRRRLWVGGALQERTQPWGVLSRIAAALSADIGRSPVWSEPDPEASPVYVGKAFLDDLRNIGPLILVLDDVQWADRQSQAALRSAALRMLDMPVLVIVVWNDQLGVDESWHRIFQEEHGEVIQLTGLAVPELVLLAVARGHLGLSPAGAARLHAHTGGNPLHASTLLDLVPMRDIAFGLGPLPAPQDIAGAVAAKLTVLTSAALSLLQAAAVLGKTFGSAQAAALAGLTDPGPPLDEAIDAGLVTPVPAAADRTFSFSHMLIHLAVYEHTGLARRRELHRMAAAILGGSAALRHRVAAADGPDEVLADDLDRQADLETARGELAAAASHRQEALLNTPPGQRRGPRLLSVVEAQLIAGDAVAAKQYAEELRAGGGDPWWDYVTGYQLLLDIVRVDDATIRLKSALRAIGSQPPRPGTPPDLRARIATQLAVIALVSLSHREMIRYGQMAVAAESPDPRVQAFAWFARTVGLTLAGSGEQALADLAAHGLSHDLDILVARGITQLWTDDLDAACQNLGEAVARAYRGEALRVGQALAFLGDAEYRRGLLDDSVLHTELAVGDAEENQRFWDYALLHALACQPHAARGDWALAQAHRQAAAQWAVTRVGRLAAAGARAMIAQAQSDVPGLLAAAEEVDANLDAPEPGITLFGPLRAEALAQLRRPDDADEALTAFAERFAASGRKSTLMAIARVRGRIAVARGERGIALAAYSTALDLAESVGLPLEAGRIEMLMGECLAAEHRYNAAGIRLRSGLRRFTEIGANAYAAQAQALISDVGIPAGQSGPLETLSLAERRVAELIKHQAALSNEEICQQLRLSKKAVEFHLTRIYTKLGIAGPNKRTALRRLLNESDHGPRVVP